MSHYGYLEHSAYLAHHGVKGMKWGVRKAKSAWQNHWRKQASNYTKIRDFRDKSEKEKSRLKGEYKTWNAKQYTSSQNKGKDYRSKKRQYKQDLRDLGRNINVMKSPWITRGEKVAYINSDIKKRRALNALYTGQSLAEMELAKAAVIGSMNLAKNANDKRLIKKAEKQYGLSHSELYHHGIKGMKWGVRRYQNADGSLTPEGIKRYGSVSNLNKARLQKKYKIRRAAAITAASLAAAGIITGTALIAKKKFSKVNSIEKNKEKINKSLNEIKTEPKISNKTKESLKKQSDDFRKAINNKVNEMKKSESSSKPKKQESKKYELESVIIDGKKAPINRPSSLTDKQSYWRSMVRQYGPQLYVTDSTIKEMHPDDASWYIKDNNGRYKYDLDRHYGLR